MKTRNFTFTIVIFAVLLFHNFSLNSQWFPLTTGITENLKDVFFVNENTGIAVGSSGKIIRTTNAGLNWTSVSSGTTNTLYTLDYPPNNVIYGGGQAGTVLRSENNGVSWVSRPGCSIHVYSIAFVNYFTGITAGGGSLMCYTSDGGTSWNPRYIPSMQATGVTFTNPTTIIVCASDMNGASIFKSTNSGFNFSTVLSLVNSGTGTQYNLHGIYFRNQVTGYCAGRYIQSSQSYGVVYKTTNGGDNWLSTGGTSAPSGNNCLYGIHFGDDNNGFAVGNNGVLLRTTNAGLNWLEQSSSVTANLNSVYMLNALTGYACGENGTILKTTNGGVVGFIKPGCNIPLQTRMHQNFPNPFNPSTMITYELHAEGIINLVVYDAIGRIVEVLVNEQKQPGIYEVEWDGTNYPSGIYFCKLTMNNFTETNKMILSK